MSRARLAIAHFACAESAAIVRRALMSKGASDVIVLAEPAGSRDSGHRLEVPLPATIERSLLNILLSSDAVRVDIHDAD